MLAKVRLTRLERATCGFEVRCSIRLSYKREREIYEISHKQKKLTRKESVFLGVPGGI